MSDKTSDHLNLLAIFYFIYSALVCCALPMLAIQAAVLRAAPAPPANPDFNTMVTVMHVFQAIGAVFVLILMAMNIATGFSLRARKNRMLCLVTAGIDCMSVPLGTLLGVFTFVVLLSDDGKRLFETARNGKRMFESPGEPMK